MKVHRKKQNISESSWNLYSKGLRKMQSYYMCTAWYGKKERQGGKEEKKKEKKETEKKKKAEH